MSLALNYAGVHSAVMLRNLEKAENQIAQRIIGAGIEVHKQLGPGLLEKAYEVCLAHELTERKIRFVRQLPPIELKSPRALRALRGLTAWRLRGSYAGRHGAGCPWSLECLRQTSQDDESTGEMDECTVYVVEPLPTHGDPPKV